MRFLGYLIKELASGASLKFVTVLETLFQAPLNVLTTQVLWTLPENFSDDDLHNTLFPKNKLQVSSLKHMPDYEYIHKELAKSGVTLTLLWHEYCERCRLSNEIPFMYTQFCKYYRDFVQTHKATMHIERKPGEHLEVDWAGQNAFIVNSDTGELITDYIFVATLPCSQYSYVEAFLSQNQESWIAAHNHAYQFFGGVTKILIPDNLKTGVEKVPKNETIINKTYNELAEHYGTVVIPARVRKPKDKASVEGNVGIISTWILAAIRNQKFFSLRDLNKEIWLQLERFNTKPFQKRSGSRLSCFLEEEKEWLMPLPKTPFEISLWKVATVQFNYPITFDKINYSVPYEYIKHKVDVRLTRNVVEVFYKNNRICSHPRLHGREGQYSTVIDHMPNDHKQYVEWNEERFISWADNIGPHTSIVIKSILNSQRVKQQGYKSFMGILKLGDKYNLNRLKAACKKALAYTVYPSYKSISTILKTGQENVQAESVPQTNQNCEEFGFTRGADYYGGNSTC